MPEDPEYRTTQPSAVSSPRRCPNPHKVECGGRKQDKRERKWERGQRNAFSTRAELVPNDELAHAVRSHQDGVATLRCMCAQQHIIRKTSALCIPGTAMNCGQALVRLGPGLLVFETTCVFNRHLRPNTTLGLVRVVAGCSSPPWQVWPTGQASSAKG